ncbi:SPL family radical SAM protein [Cohnella algarum]|uniref:SPL family radical SAM protein n=1 Tax=Cohnella algarum TaxID=2044859 RepID=UPI0030842CDC
MAKTQYEPMKSKTVLNAVRAPSMPFDWSINPYRGCQHGCSFCYARSTHVFLGQPADDAFQHRIFWKEDAPSLLRQELRRMAAASRLPSSVAIGTATDSYQQLESKALLTRGCLEALAEFGVPVSITTRSPLVLRDLDLLRRLPDVSVNISLHTLDPQIWRAFEPQTPAPLQRLRCARALREAGIETHVFMAPMLPYLTDRPEAVESLLSACADHGIRQVMASFLRLSTPEVKSWFFSVLRQGYPELAERYGRLYWRSSRLPDSYVRPVKARLADCFRRYGMNGGDFYEPERDSASNPAAEVPSAQAPCAPCAPEQLTLF